MQLTENEKAFISAAQMMQDLEGAFCFADLSCHGYNVPYKTCFATYGSLTRKGTVIPCGDDGWAVIDV